MFDKIKKVIINIAVLGIELVILIPILGFSLAILVGGIVIGVVIKVPMSLIKLHKYKKDALNDLKNKYINQFDVANKLVENVQLARDKDNNPVYVEELISFTEQDSDTIEESLASYQKYKWESTKNAHDKTQAEIATTINRTLLEKLKQELTMKSFEMQDIAKENNIFLKPYENLEDICENKEDFMKKSDELKREIKLKKMK